VEYAQVTIKTVAKLALVQSMGLHISTKKQLISATYVIVRPQNITSRNRMGMPTYISRRALIQESLHKRRINQQELPLNRLSV
jgi:hypothetical protein